MTVVRPKVLGRVSKGVIMPGMLPEAYPLIREADIVNLHLPQLDAAPISVLSRLLRKPVVLTYHCDLQLPKGIIHSIANQVSHLANHISARSADRIVTNTRDYAENSPFLRHYLDKVHVIPPPVELAPVTGLDVEAFRNKYEIRNGQRIIGMAARLATEKGVEYLIEALPGVIKRHPNARVLFVGQYKDVLGEEQYAAMLEPLLRELGKHWSFLGLLSPVELAVFFRLSDVTVLPSINGTESFGMVQVEAMTCGTPGGRFRFARGAAAGIDHRHGTDCPPTRPGCARTSADRGPRPERPVPGEWQRKLRNGSPRRPSPASTKPCIKR